MVLILCAGLGWLQFAHYTWSGRDWWVWEGGWGERVSCPSTGSTDGSGNSGYTSPCEEGSLQGRAARSSILLLSPLCLAMGSAPRWQHQSYFGGEDDALSLPIMLPAPYCVTIKHAAMSWLPVHQEHDTGCPPPAVSHAAMPALWQDFFGSPTPTVLLPQLADLQMRNATAPRLIKSLQGLFLHVSA